MADRPVRRPVVPLALGTLLTLTAIAWVLDVPRWLDWELFTEQFLAAVLALALPLAFLVQAQRRDFARAWRPAYVALALLAGAALGYVALRYPALQSAYMDRPWHGVALGALILVLVLEAVRRCCGTALFIVLLVFIGYALAGHLLPGIFRAQPVQPERLALYLAFDTNALIGTSLLVAAEIVIPFILMGQILARGGGSDWFNDLSLALLGRSRGGGGKIAVASSLLFGLVSGSAVANVVSGGIITIPLMIRSGMQPHRAAAVEAVSSTGGQLVPPVMGAAAFLMAEYLSVPYRTVALAALAPSLLFYLALYLWCDFAAGRDRLAPVDAAQLPRARSVLLSGWHFPLPFALLFVALFWWNWPAQLAALLACAVLYGTSLVFGYRGRRMGARDVWWTITSTGPACLDVIVICAAAGIVIGVLNLSGLAFALTLFLGQLAAANLFLLLAVTACIAMVLGMGMPTTGVYVLLAALMGPAMIKAGLDPVAAHMFLLYFGMMSMITPPVALASFTAAGIAKADFWRTGWEGMRIGWICYAVPFVFVFQPGLLFRANLFDGLVELAFAALGVTLGTAALVGWLRGPLTLSWRAAAAVGAALLLVPLATGETAWLVNFAGAVLAAAVILADRRVARAVAP
jgi:TRAP transporter 4TM/12TM fusion protein